MSVRIVALSVGLWLLAARGAAAMAEPTPTSTASRVEVRGEWLYVDGEPFLVKGIGYSPYRPGQVPWRDRVDPAVMERDFQRIVEAGFNTIRTWSPLPPESLALADRYGLMVLQGIWVEQHGDYTLPAFQETMAEVIRKEVERARGQRNVLAVLVGNELQPEQVFRTTIPEIEALLTRAAQTVKEADPQRLVSYTNWPSLFFLDASMWDFVGFNLYPYEPPSVSSVFGFRSYVEHLKRTVARGTPLVITEVGLSVSPGSPSKPGYGGWTPQTQQTALVTLWEDLFQGGAQGGVIFEWNDEWWKHMESSEDAQGHESQDPEEWFGLTEFLARDAPLEGTARPVYEAVKSHNQAILLSPVTEEWYQEVLPVTVYANEGVAQIRVRLDQGKWDTATKLNRHWWKVRVPIGSTVRSGEHRFTMEVYDSKHRLLLRRERPVLVGPPHPPVKLSLTADREFYDVGETIESATYAIAVTDAAGIPLPNTTAFLTMTEPQTRIDLTQTKITDAAGRIEGTYLIREPGIVTVSAATPRDGKASERRVGQETVFIVRQQPSARHRPSIWEANVPEVIHEALRRPPAFRLADPGKERVVQYERYGTFHDVGTSHYRYDVTDWAGLAAAVGEGIYPNEGGLMKDPAYQAAKAAGTLEGSHWDFTFHEDPQLAFFKWAETNEEEGVKQFYTALTLERAGLWLQAVKAYDAVLVHFPRSIGWTAFDPPTPWYVGKVARDKIEAILRLHPELGMRLEGARIIVEHGFDNQVDNDTISTFPGTLVAVAPDAVNPPPVDLTSLTKTREVGKGRVRLVQFDNGHWQLTVDGAPWTVRGLTYKPTAVGETPDEATVRDWMTADRNGNGRIDVLETFVDANRNNAKDPEELAVGDFALIHAMGVNTLRLYHTDHELKQAKPILRRLYEEYGVRVMMGDFVGMYTIGSGAKWEEGTNYLDKTQRKRMVESVKAMVREFKDEPYLLMWVLGNENNYGGVHGIVGGAGNAGTYPKEYYRFVNELASWIHEEDPDHPVAIGNGDLLFLDIIAQEAPAIDILGANAYRGWHGVGRTFFEEVQRMVGRPVMITEFGCPAYQKGQPREMGELDQALYHVGSWVDLADNMAGRGVGNVIGGVVFEWADEWWKAGQPPRFSPTVQETQPNWAGPFPGGWNFEEWFGLMSQGDGTLSPFLRQPRVSYELYQALWSGSGEP